MDKPLNPCSASPGKRTSQVTCERKTHRNTIDPTHVFILRRPPGSGGGGRTGPQTGWTGRLTDRMTSNRGWGRKAPSGAEKMEAPLCGVLDGGVAVCSVLSSPVNVYFSRKAVAVLAEER